MKRQTSQLLTAPAGTGKSYFVTLDLVNEFLPSSSGRVFTNMPFGVVPDGHSSPPKFSGETFADRIGEYVASRSDLESHDVTDRIQLIPRDVLNSWMFDGRKAELSGPWEYFEGFDLQNDLIVIDEAHNFCGRSHSREKKRLWMQFCGELRHRGHSAIQFVTQSPNKLAKEIIDECGKRQALIDAEEERDPFFKIQLAYWYELRAKLTGKYTSCFVRIDLRDIDGKKSRNHVVRVPRRPEIFALYDSFNATEAGEAGSGGRQKREFEKRGWLSFIWWFVSRNAGAFFRPGMFLVFLYLAFFHGGQIFGLITSSVGGTLSPRPNAVADRRDFVARPATVETGVNDVEEEVVFVEEFALRLITPDAVSFSDGFILRKGDWVATGPFQDWQVVKIDYQRRAVMVQTTDDTKFLFLGRVYHAEGQEHRTADSAPRVGDGSSGGGRGPSVR